MLPPISLPKESDAENRFSIDLGIVCQPPFRANKEVGLNQQELSEDEGEALIGRFLERDQPDPVFVHLQVENYISFHNDERLHSALGYVVTLR